MAGPLFLCSWTDCSMVIKMLPIAEGLPEHTILCFCLGSPCVLYLSFPWLVSVGTTHRAAGVCGACCGWPCCRVLAVRLACSAVVEGRTAMLAPLLCPRFSCGA